MKKIVFLIVILLALLTLPSLRMEKVEAASAGIAFVQGPAQGYSASSTISVTMACTI